MVDISDTPKEVCEIRFWMRSLKADLLLKGRYAHRTDA